MPVPRMPSGVVIPLTTAPRGRSLARLALQLVHRVHGAGDAVDDVGEAVAERLDPAEHGVRGRTGVRWRGTRVHLRTRARVRGRARARGPGRRLEDPAEAPARGRRRRLAGGRRRLGAPGGLWNGA